MSETQQWINLIFVVALLAVALSFLPTSLQRRWWVKFGLAVPMAVALIAAVYFADPYIDLAEEKYASLIASVQGKVLIGMLVIALGCGAHFFKMKSKLRYGQVEILFGAFSAASISGGLGANETLSQWIGLAGSAYVVARGLNNWSDALDEDWKTNKHGFPSIKHHVLSWFWIQDSEETTRQEYSLSVAPATPQAEKPGGVSRPDGSRSPR